MPREDLHATPLKRGNACLYCRKRRIRCSAAKPTCQRCLKAGKECVYDEKKPIGRVQQLEEKVAQLEGLLKNNLNEAGQAGRVGDGILPVPGPLLHHSSDDSIPGPSQLSNYNFSKAESSEPDLYGGSHSPQTSAGNGPDSTFANLKGFTFGGLGIMPTPSAGPQEPAFDFGTLDPVLMGLVSSFQATSGINEPIPQRSSPIGTQAPASIPPTTTVFPAQYTSNVATNPSSGDSSAYSGADSTLFGISPRSSYNYTTQPLFHTPSFSLTKQLTESQTYFEDVGKMSDGKKPSSSRHDLSGLAQAESNVNEDMAALLKAAEELKPEHWEQGSIRDAGAEMGQKRFPLVGGWFDAEDLPKIARDHLLDIFFSGTRLLGHNFHIPRFMASLTLSPSKRPHPCLLYSMYTMASSISTSPQIHQLESHFYKIATRQADEAISKIDRLLDATRACTILSAYNYSRANYHQGWMMAGQAARLAISCGLHQIRSSVWKPNLVPEAAAEMARLIRAQSYVLPPSKDAVEHGERIWAFWSLYITDRCGSISTQWTPAITDDVITTPFPRPLQEYELGLVTEADDISIASIQTPSYLIRSRPFQYDYADILSFQIRAIAILERSSKLMYVSPEPGWDAELDRSRSKSTGTPEDGHDLSFNHTPLTGTSTNGADESSYRKGKGWTKTAKVRTPKAYQQVKQSLLMIEDDLPEKWRTNWLEWDGKVQEWHFCGARKDVVTLHFMLGCAWMFLEDVYTFNAENTAAVNVAKRLTVTARYLQSQSVHADLDVFTVMMWSFISKILIRDMKRLQNLGDKDGAAAIEIDVEMIVQALREFGRYNTVGQSQAMIAEKYRQSAWNDITFLKNNDDD
ncbi:uncharacterized protein L203_102693 [Cryptococcus depauperatus CBS 7841]|uniref:Zn(2)-C6 fungal-type domain-containing protein n=1 Tax=Cryptococcus depauperatus CBS 7841 TaxID=1295531 RepID=A0AAJ8M1C2_9TREE